MGVMDSEAGTGEVTIGVGVSEVGLDVAGVDNPGIDADVRSSDGRGGQLKVT